MNSATTITHSGKLQPFVQNIAKIGDSSIKKIDEIRKFEVARVIANLVFLAEILILPQCANYTTTIIIIT